MGRTNDPITIAGLRKKRGLSEQDASLCYRFRLVRINNGLSQPQYALKLGISTETVKQIETGRNTPQVDMIVALHKKFHISYHWIFTGSENS